MLSPAKPTSRFRPLLVGAMLGSALALRPQEAGPKPGEAWLQIPEQSATVRPNGSLALSSPKISFLQIRIYTASTGHVSYGSIHVKINTEAANPLMTLTGTAEGILCNLDLNRRGGFEIGPGRNSVEIEFADHRQRIHYASYLLILPDANELQARLPPSQPPTRLTGDKYAVVIGISKYQRGGSGLNNLRYADRDAQDFLKFLKSPAGGGFREENVRHLFNEEATTENIRTALFNFLTKPSEADTVILYIASHGDEDPHDRRNLYLITYDTDPDNMGGTALPMEDLETLYRRKIKTRRVITFVDSCHSYGISGERTGASTEEENNLINQYLVKHASDSERAVLSASDISEESQEDERWGGGHGVFTYYLLQGLQGAADANHDGTVTTGELFKYVRTQVMTATLRKQHPRAIIGSAENIPVSGSLVSAGLGNTKDEQAPRRESDRSRGEPH
jgi:uncharacterized caspase-like protein